MLASRADKETEGENGAELALLRIELDTAREDIKRKKEKAAVDKRMLEECRKKLERLEDAASPRKRKKRQASPHKKDEEDAMKDMEDVTMAEEGRENTPESVAVAIATGTEQGVALPPREEWSPVMRLQIEGISKRLEDPVPSPSGKRDLDGLIMERLDSILIKWLEGRKIVLPVLISVSAPLKRAQFISEGESNGGQGENPITIKKVLKKKGKGQKRAGSRDPSAQKPAPTGRKELVCEAR